MSNPASPDPSPTRFPLPHILGALVRLGPLSEGEWDQYQVTPRAFIDSEAGVHALDFMPDCYCPDEACGAMDTPAGAKAEADREAWIEVLAFLRAVGGDLVSVLAGFPAPSLIYLGEDGATVELPDGGEWTVDIGGYWHGGGSHYLPLPLCSIGSGHPESAWMAIADRNGAVTPTL